MSQSPAVRAAGALLAGVLGAIGLAACGSGAKPALRLGAIYPVRGAYGQAGIEEWRGAELAVALANQQGGLGGRRIEVDLQDAESPDFVPAALDRLHAKGIDVIVGTHQSVLSSVAGAGAAERGQLLWETGAVGETSADMGAGRNFFRLAPMGANLGRAAVDFVNGEVRPKLPARAQLKYAVAYVDDVYGRAVGQGALAEVGARGQPLVGTFPYRPGTMEFSGLVSQIAAAKPDVLVVVAYVQDGIALRRATVAAKVPLLASIGTSSSYCMPEFGVPLGPEAVGLFASDKPDGDVVRADALLPAARAELAWATAQYRTRWHAVMSAPALAGFANTWALVGHVLPNLGPGATVTPGAVAAAALATKLPAGSLANGSGLDLAPPGAPDAGANRAATSVIWEWVAPGRRAVVWPPEFATAQVAVLPIL
jgi:ABC-type branched-subunit amino acid transport system substrate-binding protein